MFLPLPLGDYPNPSKAQWVTRILVGFNIAIHVFVTAPSAGHGVVEDYLADAGTRRAVNEIWAASPGEQATFQSKEQWLPTVSRYRVLLWRYGYKPALPDLLALLACMFLHADFLHLFVNLLYLWIFGDNVESRLGRLGFLFAYLGTGAIATLSYAFLNPESTVPLVGASGAISAVLGFYLVWFPRNLIRVFIWFLIFIQIFYIRAIWVLAAYVLVDNLLLPLVIEPMLHGPGQGGGVAYGAHLAGFAAGVLAAYLIDLVRGRRPAPRPHTSPGPQPLRWRGPIRAREDAGERFQRAMREGRMEEAADAFALLSREGGVTPLPAQVFRLGRWLYEGYLVPDAAAVFRFYIRNFPNGEDLDRVHLGLGVLLVRQMGQAAAGREHLLAVLDLTGDDAVAEIARAELKRLEDGPPPQPSM